MVSQNEALDFIVTWCERIIDPRHPFCWIFWLSSIVVAILFYYFSYGDQWKHLLYKEIKNPTFEKELWFDVKNFALKFVIDVSAFVFIGLNINAIAHILFDNYGKPFFLSFDNQPLILDGTIGRFYYTAFLFLLWDFGNFMGHYCVHKIPPLWQFHRFHHLADSLNPLTQYRIHPVDLIIEYVIQGIVVIACVSVFHFFIEIPYGERRFDTSIVLFVYFFYAKLRHSFVKISFGPYLSYIFMSPYMHQIHHGASTQHLNKNFGTMFSLWDTLFGTLYIPRPDEELDIGDKVSGPKNQSLTFELLRPFYELGLLPKRKISKIPHKTLE